ncbi:MAG: hypothetical protein H7281_00405 [Bacteriovorax sp.]|nr:hypothetical protein [Bacteriovorax sp.]
MNDTTSKKTWYINSKTTDLLFIVLCPLLAFLFVAAICEPRSKNGAFIYGTETPYWFAISATLLTHMHVLLVFTRSHLNKSVFMRYKYRFTLVPLVVLSCMWISPFLFGALGVLALYWGEWHSIMQTFGFGRIYDGRHGNDPLKGRKLDMGMCFVLGLLPHLILLTYLPDSQRDAGLIKYLELSQNIINNYSWVLKLIRIPLYTFGVGYTIFYIQSYRRFHKEGYSFPKAKFALFAVTGITTILTASIFTIADGIFFGNIYHALQYVFIVLISERNNLSNITGMKQKSNQGVNLLYFLVIIPFVIVFAAIRQTTSGVEFLAAFWLLTSLMHFWFDGFIWSVRRQDV